MPRIVLSKEAKNLWQTNDFNKQTSMCKSYDDFTIVNTLHHAYVDTYYIEDGYTSYLRIVNDNIERTQSGAQEKWVWFRDYLQEEAKVIGFNLNK